MVYIDLNTCSECDAVYGNNTLSWDCPVCTLKKELQEKIDELNELIRSFHPLE